MGPEGMTFAREVSGRVRCGLAVFAGAALLTLTVGGCSSDGDDGDDAARGTSTTQTTAPSTATTVDRPDGPAADLSEELTGGDGIYIGAAEPSELEGYEELEYVAAGTASSYSAAGEMDADGAWTFEPGASADYRTRVIVRRPANVGDASGTVLVEWLNVSGGVDADPEFVTLREEILRQGHTWVGVSAQSTGVEGGPVAVRVDVPGSEAAGKGIKTLDPERYGSLEHPGDAFSYDIFTQIARAVRAGAVLGELEPSSVVAVGESQSAFALVTYVNGVQPLTKAFDGFFVHSRGASGLGLSEAGEAGRHLELHRRHQDHLPHRHRRPDLQRADGERCGRRLQHRGGAPARHRPVQALGGSRHGPRRPAPRRREHGGDRRLWSADQRRPVPHRGQGGAAPLRRLGRGW